MIKLHISNIDSFFETVNECNGSVNVIDANGNSTNIAHQIFEQRKLYKAYYQNKKCLDLCLISLIRVITLKLFLIMPGIVKHS